MKRTMRLMFLAVEINLLLWLAVLGIVFGPVGAEQSVKTVVVIGIVFAAVVQHWAYYSIYKRAREMT